MFFVFRFRFVATAAEEAAIIAEELGRFREMPEESLDEDCLLLWKKHSAKFPNLAKFARFVFAIQATSAPVEGQFSVAGLTLTKLRNRLHSDVASDLIFLHESWATLDAIQPHWFVEVLRE